MSFIAVLPRLDRPGARVEVGLFGLIVESGNVLHVGLVETDQREGSSDLVQCLRVAEAYLIRTAPVRKRPR